jgi:pSer/pThr/pTyr-binding forkhead associated (FHA) protein
VGDATYVLRASVTRIGRGADSDLRLDDPGVSRNHAEIRLQGGDVVIVDAGSTNGVLIDNERVERARLTDGSRVMLGNTHLVFHAGER